MNKAQNIPAVILAQVSDKEQSKGESLKAQKERLYSLAQKKGFKKSDIKVYEFVESSTIGGRKKFYEVIEWVEQQQTTVHLFVEAVDRLQRSFEETAIIEKLCNSGKLKVHLNKERITLDENISFQDSIMWDVSVIGAKMYVQSISHNVKRSNEQKLKNGEILGPAPLGYLNIRDKNGNSNVILDPNKWHFIKELFEKYSTGQYSIGEITKLMNKNGLRTKRDKIVNTSTIHNILKNKFYIGIMTCKGSEYPHKYETFIDKYTFQKCQDIRLKRNNQPVNKDSKHAEKHIFRGLLKCHHCGCTISTDGPKRNGKKYLFCSKYHDKNKPKKDRCKQTRPNEVNILEAAEKIFAKIYITEPIAEELCNLLKKKLEDKYNSEALKYESLEKQEIIIDQKLDRLLDTHISGRITEETFNKKSAELKEEQERIRTAKELYTESDKKFELTVPYLLHVASKAKDLFKCSKVERKRALLKFLLSNASLKRGKLQYELKKPFNTLEEFSKFANWLPILDKFGTKYRSEILHLYSECKRFSFGGSISFPKNEVGTCSLAFS